MSNSAKSLASKAKSTVQQVLPSSAMSAEMSIHLQEEKVGLLQNRPLEIDNELRKLIQIYNGGENAEVLTSQQFQTLLHDIYSTIDSETLTREDITFITNMVDSSKDGLIDREELKRISKENSQESKKNFVDTK